MYLQAKTGELIEWDYTSVVSYDDAFNEIELDVVIHSPKGEKWVVPTFWRGGLRWSVRFIAKDTGLYTLVSMCSDTENSYLHDIRGQLDVRQGQDIFPQVLALSSDHSYLIEETKKPFFWLADTWWMALSQRLSFPEDFKTLTDKRKEQGYNVIMFVAGLFPDMDSFDPRASNEAGLPWEQAYTRINPAYFDEADKRVDYLITAGLVPCIVGAWGYYLLHLGEQKMKQHWRYIIARWGAYPVVWTIAGEATMPFYLSEDKANDTVSLRQGWTEIGHYIKKIEAFGRLITIHPTEVGRKQLDDDTMLDINLIQSGHNGYESVSHTAKLLGQELKYSHKMPLLMGESNYEGILRDTHPAVQRLTFWTAILSGSKGYTYGANGIWQVNTKTLAFGATPHGGTWGNTPWQVSYKYQGARQLGYAKTLLSKYPWWLLKPQPECLLPYQESVDARSVRVAGIDKKLRIHYFYGPVAPWHEPKYQLIHLEKNSKYRAYFWDPQTAKVYPIPDIQTDSNGSWEMLATPTFEDWIFIVEYVSISHSMKPSVKKSLKDRTLRALKISVKKFIS